MIMGIESANKAFAIAISTVKNLSDIAKKIKNVEFEDRIANLKLSLSEI
jgi:hypothetical protein